MEVQLGQITNQLSRRPYGNLPSNTEKNLREELKAITLKNGREIEEAERESKEKVKRLWLNHLN